MNAPPFLTSPDDLTNRGWARLGALWITASPLWDDANDVFAELTYEGALAAAEGLGGRLPEREELIALNDAGLRLAPVTLPSTDMLSPHMSQGDIDAFRDANMGGLEWAQIHTERVQAQLTAAGWDGASLVANAGKHWLRGAPPGRAYLMGWWVGGAGGHFIQSGLSAPGPGPHDDQHHDYGTTTVVVRETDPEGAS